MTSISSSDRPLRVAFIGGGQMARNHLAGIRRLTRPVTVVGVTDRSPVAAHQFAALAGVRPSSSIAALLSETRPDIVHICTPPAAHFEAAYAALDHGAHVYIEKPFALTTEDAEKLITLACARRRLVCAGHQLLRDRAFEKMMARVPELGTVVSVDSHFTFRPTGGSGSGARALAEQAIDILPHPLYTLIAVLERFGGTGAPIDLVWSLASSSDLHAVLRVGTVVGRLSVSLRARPIASSLTVWGTHGSLTCDFVRSTLIGTANAGTEAIEKILNPMVDGLHLVARTAVSLGRRLHSGESYPGLQSLIEGFYRAVAQHNPSPIPAEHLFHVTQIFEQLVAQIEKAAHESAASRCRPVQPKSRPRVVLTGARGFLGAELARALQSVRGIGRGRHPDSASVHEWVCADLADGLTPDALAGAEVVVHAAAETAGGYEAHQRNSLDATERLLEAMQAAGVKRLVLVSSLSVLRPPRVPWERQDESTPRAVDPKRLGAYTWGKSRQEELVERETPGLGIATRIVRPGALVDWSGLPGLMGRHLYGAWYLGLGRPSLPIAVCDVGTCADAIAWCAMHFDDAPPVVNLFDPALVTRREFIAELRQRGWQGRVVWVPISLVSAGLVAARTVLSIAHGTLPERLAAWSVLRPRRYDSRLATALLQAANRDDSERLAIGA